MSSRDRTTAAFASRLREARKASGMSVRALAGAAGVTPDALYRLEAGKGGANLATAVEIARVLPGMEGLDWLIGEASG